jgi:hypothetical protein
MDGLNLAFVVGLPKAGAFGGLLEDGEPPPVPNIGVRSELDGAVLSR